MSKQLNNQIRNATKWSVITEVIAKLIAPITNMVLARLVTPDAFGLIATIQIIITFAEVFTDAGFQKYIIQHQFVNDEDRDESSNVAFWSNLLGSVIIWGLIALFSEPLATLVGNPGFGNVLIIACISIPLFSLSSIQMAQYRRDLDFKTLFRVRIAGVLTPLLITIPLALYFRNFWALLIGNIVKDVVNALILTLFSRWKPRLFFSVKKFKSMFSFTMWSMIEAISIWLTGFVDVFFIGTILNQYYLGLYKTSSGIVNQCMSLIVVTTTPILFSSLSKLQDDRSEFKKLFFKFQRMVGLIVIPIGFGLYCYSDFVTKLLLGEQWLEASDFIGLWGLMSGISIVLSHYSSEVYRSLGRPKLSVIAQWLHIVVLCPVVVVSSEHGFDCLCICRSFIRFEMILVNLVIMHYIVGISSWKIISNVSDFIIAAGIISLLPLTISHLIPENNTVKILSIPICLILYFVVIFTKSDNRELFKMLIQNRK